MNLTDEQKDLLRKIVGVHESGDKSQFQVVRMSEGSRLLYKLNSIQIENDDSDFFLLRDEGLLSLHYNPGLSLCGKPTAHGIEVVRSSFAPPSCESLADVSHPEATASAMELDFDRHSTSEETLPEDIRDRIRKGLLRIHSKRLEGAKLLECLRKTYNLYAGELVKAGEPLTDALLTDSLPAWVFRAAIAQKWIPYPLIRPITGVVGNLLEGWYNPAGHKVVPQAELTETFGGYKVTKGFEARFKKKLESRIAYWRAGPSPQEMAALDSATPVEDRDEPTHLKYWAIKENDASVRTYKTVTGRNIDRLRKECGWSFDRLAEKTGLDKTLILGHVNRGTRPQARTLLTYAQGFTKGLGRPVTVAELEQ